MPNIVALPITGIETLPMGSVLQNQLLMVGKPGASAIEHTKVQPACYHYYSVQF